MEALSGLDFHAYVLDFDGDGLLDIVVPDRATSTLGFLTSNPDYISARKLAATHNPTELMNPSEESLKSTQHWSF